MTDPTPSNTAPVAPEPRPVPQQQHGDEADQVDTTDRNAGASSDRTQPLDHAGGIEQADQPDEAVPVDRVEPTAQSDPIDQAESDHVARPVDPPATTAPVGLRVSDADREAVAQALRQAGLEGRLSPDELATREAAAYAAVTAPDLFALVTDLPVARELAASQLAGYGLRWEPVDAASGRPHPSNAPATGTTPTTLRSILGEVKRTGPWEVPARLSVQLALGETRLDLRDATLTAPVTTIDILGTLGEVKVIVPDSWRIECSGSGVLGGYQVKDVDAAVPPAPDAPLLRFTGAMVLGEVTIFRTHAAPGTGAFSIDGMAGLRNRRHEARQRRRSRHGWHGGWS